MSITKVIKTSIDSNTIFGIQKDAAQNVHTIGITNLYYTDSSFANTANTTISSNTDSYIKIFGFGFQPNANVLLMPSQNTYLYSPEMVSFFENSIEANSYYVNWAEYRLKIQGHSANTFPVATEYDVFLINQDGTNTSFKRSLKFSPLNQYYGWISGSNSTLPTFTGRIFRLNFTNETFTTNNNSIENKRGMYSVCDRNYGWLLGGEQATSFPGTFSKLSSVGRLNLFNDVSSLIPRNNLGIERSLGTTSKSNTQGYIIGGISPTAYLGSTDRLDFNNDTIFLLSRGPLSAARSNTSTVKNFTYSWIGMGESPPGIQSSVSRLDFSNDTSADVIRVNGTARRGLSSTYNLTFGWFSAGTSGPGAPGARSLVERITFSSDTSALSSRGSLSTARSYLCSTGDYSYGWYVSGDVGIASVTTVDRITYSNDTITASVRTGADLMSHGTAMTNIL